MQLAADDRRRPGGLDGELYVDAVCSKRVDTQDLDLAEDVRAEDVVTAQVGAGRGRQRQRVIDVDVVGQRQHQHAREKIRFWSPEIRISPLEMM